MRQPAAPFVAWNGWGGRTEIPNTVFGRLTTRCAGQMGSVNGVMRERSWRCEVDKQESVSGEHSRGEDRFGRLIGTPSVRMPRPYDAYPLPGEHVATV
jgi:hypothetical protein